MTRFALISAFALTAAAPAFAADDLVNLGKTSPAEIADEHNIESDFMTEEDLGATSAAVINESENDLISTQNFDEQERLNLLGVTSPAERAARD